MSLFNKFKQGLQKTRDFIAGGIKQIGLASGRFDEERLDELEMILIQTDMGARAVDEVMGNLRAEIKRTRNDQESFVRSYLKEEILRILGQKETLKLLPNRLNIIMMVGVNGTGKTTTAGKLALRYKEEGKKVLMAAADTFRAAAIEQLQVWADRTDSEMIRHDMGSDPAAVVFDAVAAAKARKTDVLLVDTAGRLHNKKNLMDELAKMRRIIDREAPDANVETLLVIDATSGQNAILQAQVFTEVADVTGLAITKLDGNSKGGVAIAVAYETKSPIYLAGLGEQADDLMDFDPGAFAESLLPDAENE